jgi:hypothetical protein
MGFLRWLVGWRLVWWIMGFFRWRGQLQLGIKWIIGRILGFIRRIFGRIFGIVRWQQRRSSRTTARPVLKDACAEGCPSQ